MARIDFYAIEQAIRQQLLAYEALRDRITCEIEREPVFGDGDVVLIYLQRRDAPEDLQTISAGTRTMMQLRFSIWCFHYGLEDQQMFQGRDDLVGKVELALMSDHTLGGTVETSMLNGGEFETLQAQEAGGYTIGAEVVLLANVAAASV